MPTYDYECLNGHAFEYLQSITATPLTECPTCGADVRRLIGGGTGIIFKGSGFYVTDSKNGRRGSGAANKDADKSAAGDGKDSSDKAAKAKNSESVATTGGEKQAKPAATRS